MDRRSFLLTAGFAAAALAAPGAASAAAPLEAAAERRPGGKVRLTWTGGAAAQIFASSDPDAPRALMRPLTAGAGGAADAAVATSPRPYFLVATKDAAVRTAERILPLEGGRNFRDLGGYRTEDGRQVRWGRLYRSGVMAGLTASDLAYVNGLGIRFICDLRAPGERSREPHPFTGPDAPAMASFDYDMSRSMAGVLGARTRADAVAAFADAYVDMAQYLAPNYADMFERLLRRETPLTVNCSAGKDRTGVAAALILSVLGASRDTVVADYALSQTFVPPALYRDQIRKSAAVSRESAAFAAMPDEAMDVVMGSDPDVMRRALARFDAEFGGPIGLAKTRYGLDDAKIARLRTLYLG